MGFVPFIDDLGFIVVLIIFGAALFLYTSIKALLAILRNDPKGLRSLLKASAIPVGVIGAIGALMGIFTEMTWPFLLSDGLGSYDIFFGDVIMVFSMVMLVYAFIAYFGLKLEYAGFFGLVAGIVTAWYGYWGYTTLVAPGSWGLTKDPLDTFLMYLCFAGAAFFAYPATLAVDWFLEHPGPTWTPFSLAFRPSSEEKSEPVKEGRWRLPISFYLLAAWFPFFAFLALLAAWLYIGGILPGHLQSPP